jgi:hypothetical protein
VRWIFALLIPCATAFGGPILTYTFTGTAAGTIGGTPFTSAALTVSGTADASTVTCSAGICQLDLAAGVASLMIGGIGSGTFSDASYFFDNQNTAWRGLGNSGLPPTAATRLTCMIPRSPVLFSQAITSSPPSAQSVPRHRTPWFHFGAS